MKKYKIPVIWSMVDLYEIEAESIDEAIEIAEDMDLTAGEYLDGSFKVETEFIPEYNRGM